MDARQTDCSRLRVRLPPDALGPSCCLAFHHAIRVSIRVSRTASCGPAAPRARERVRRAPRAAHACAALGRAENPVPARLRLACGPRCQPGKGPGPACPAAPGRSEGLRAGPTSGPGERPGPLEPRVLRARRRAAAVRSAQRTRRPDAAWAAASSAWPCSRPRACGRQPWPRAAARSRPTAALRSLRSASARVAGQAPQQAQAWRVGQARLALHREERASLLSMRRSTWSRP